MSVSKLGACVAGTVTRGVGKIGPHGPIPLAQSTARTMGSAARATTYIHTYRHTILKCSERQKVTSVYNIPSSVFPDIVEGGHKSVIFFCLHQIRFSVSAVSSSSSLETKFYLENCISNCFCFLFLSFLVLLFFGWLVLKLLSLEGFGYQSLTAWQARENIGIDMAEKGVCINVKIMKVVTGKLSLGICATACCGGRYSVLQFSFYQVHLSFNRWVHSATWSKLSLNLSYDILISLYGNLALKDSLEIGLMKRCWTNVIFPADA